jgi:hypothetical protein
MTEKLIRSIAVAVLASVSVSIAPSFAMDLSSDDTTLMADGMFQQKQMRRVYKRTATKRAAAAKPAERVVRIETERIIEKPVIIEKEVVREVQIPAVVEEKKECLAVVESATPVVIDRYEKRRKSLIHLGLFPINLFGD